MESVRALLRIYPEGFMAQEATQWLLQPSADLNS